MNPPVEKGTVTFPSSLRVHRNCSFRLTMNRGSLNAALKKGVSVDDVNGRQMSSFNEQNQRRRAEMIQKKRGVESVVL